MKQNILMKVKYPIIEKFENMNLISFFNSFNLGKTKTHLLFQEKRVYLNNKIAHPKMVLKKGDIIEIDFNEQRDFVPDSKKLDVIYEDDYLLIVNKPCHLIVHPDDKNKRGTLCNIVSYYYQNKGYDCSIKYAHRLDIDTTGILLFAKDSLVMAKLNQLISTHTLKREYVCLVSGKLKEKKGIIDAPIGEDRHHKQRRRVSKTGQPAVTMYEVIREFKTYSYVRVILKTGRTHQIRVHMASIGHPLLGDDLYGGNTKVASRVMLHSWRVEFEHPVTGENLCVEKKIPLDMKRLMGEK